VTDLGTLSSSVVPALVTPRQSLSMPIMYLVLCVLVPILEVTKLAGALQRGTVNRHLKGPMLDPDRLPLMALQRTFEPAT
jgi:hypothetical protein